MIEMNDEYLNRFIDGDLNEEESAEFKKVLSSDPEMKRKYRMMLMLDKKLRSLKTPEPSPDFTAAMMSRLRKKPSHYKGQNLFIFSVTGFMTLVILGLTIYIFGNSISEAAYSTTGSFNFTGFLKTLFMI
jgi:anti-sigma factor RsiW